MPNDALRQALHEARLTERQLAEECGVDPKTVGRWIAADGRLPHARHRWKASEALGVDEDVLWPTAVRQSLKTGADREVVAVYPYRSACPTSVWRDLITAAASELTFAGYTSYFLWSQQPNLTTALRRKAEAGCRIRFLLGDPDSPVTRHREAQEDVPLTVSTRIRTSLAELEKLRGLDDVEVRMGDEHIALSVWIFDGQMLVTPHLAFLVGHDSPMLHVRRVQDDGIYDRFSRHAAALWETARPAWT